MADLKSLIVNYMDQQKLMQLASVADGSPWVCSVWFGYDDELNIYFFSAVTRRHSQEIEKDKRVAGAMALPHKPADPPRGLQFEGVAEKLVGDEDIVKARRTYQDRIFDAATIDGFMNHKERPHAFYRIRPSQFVLFDAVNFPDDPRQELEL